MPFRSHFLLLLLLLSYLHPRKEIFAEKKEAEEKHHFHMHVHDKNVMEREKITCHRAHHQEKIFSCKCGRHWKHLTHTRLIHRLILLWLSSAFMSLLRRRIIIPWSCWWRQRGIKSHQRCLSTLRSSFIILLSPKTVEKFLVLKIKCIEFTNHLPSSCSPVFLPLNLLHVLPLTALSPLHHKSRSILTKRWCTWRWWGRIRGRRWSRKN